MRVRSRLAANAQLGPRDCVEPAFADGFLALLANTVGALADARQGFLHLRRGLPIAAHPMQGDFTL